MPASSILRPPWPPSAFEEELTREVISADDLRFEDCGSHELKGIEGVRTLFAVAIRG